MANSLTMPSHIELSEQLKSEYNVEMLNPLSSDLSVMRQSMLFSGLESIRYNLNRKRRDLKLFEFGKTYHSYVSGRVENKHLSIFVSGNQSGESWNSAGQKGTFFYLKGVIEVIFQRLSIKNLKAAASKNDVFKAFSMKISTFFEFIFVSSFFVKI